MLPFGNELLDRHATPSSATALNPPPSTLSTSSSKIGFRLTPSVRSSRARMLFPKSYRSSRQSMKLTTPPIHPARPSICNPRALLRQTTPSPRTLGTLAALRQARGDPSSSSGRAVKVEQGMATRLHSVPPQADPLADMSLPGWLYHDPEFFAAEVAAFLRASPQIVCHESEIAAPGEWRSIDYLGEIDHRPARRRRRSPRASTTSAATAARGWSMGTGGCAKVLTCPYHAWSYDRAGALVGVPHRHEYPGLDTAQHGPQAGRARELARVPVRPARGRPALASPR